VGDSEADDRRRAARAGMALAWWAARQPERPALVSPSGRRSFAELNEGANRLVRALRARGLRAGDAVALLCGNRPEFVETVYACQRGGLRLTPINWHLTAAEVAYIVSDCEAKAVIVDAAVAPGVSGLLDHTVRLTVGGPIKSFEPYDAALAGHEGDDIEDPVLGSQMLYTSGTTGRPKGVHRASGAASVALTQFNLAGYREGGDDRHLCTGPLYHAAPLAFSLSSPLVFGVGVVLMDHWEPEEALALVEEHRITHTHMVPTMFHRLLSLPAERRTAYDLSSLRWVIHGAAPCPVEVKRRIIEWLGAEVLEYYAATEGVGTFVDAATWLAHPGTVGRPLTPGTVMVGDGEGAPVSAGEVGLVYLRAPDTARFDYFKDEAKTASAYRGDWFTLGDVGYLDDDGFLYLTDRSADVVITGGVNVYTAEVDAVLLAHPAVGDVAVIGVPDADWGEAVKAVVEPAPGTVPGPDLEAELVDFCRRRLAHYKCPRTVDFVEALPRQDTGKILKRRIRDSYRS
jgi:long-chain acyl-CoA synthetase